MSFLELKQVSSREPKIEIRTLAPGHLSISPHGPLGLEGPTHSVCRGPWPLLQSQPPHSAGEELERSQSCGQGLTLKCQIWQQGQGSELGVLLATSQQSWAGALQTGSMCAQDWGAVRPSLNDLLAPSQPALAKTCNPHLGLSGQVYNCGVFHRSA